MVRGIQKNSFVHYFFLGFRITIKTIPIDLCLITFHSLYMVGPLKDLFHRKMKQSRGELPDYYTNEISHALRLKIVLHYFDVHEPYKQISMDTWRNYCQKELDPLLAYESQFFDYLNKCSDEEFLSALQILLLLHLNAVNGNFYASQSLEQFIGLLNKLFQIEKIGYEISVAPSSHQTDVPILIIPIDSKYLHEEVIQKTRALLYKLEFDGVLNEFDKALDDSRLEKYEDSIHKIGKAYESTLKTILDKKQIPYSKGEKIPVLLTKVREALKLTNPSLNTLFDQVWPVLNQGPNVIRNFEGIGHGQGSEIIKYEKSYVNFALHLAGSYIVFLLERYEECT